MSPLRKRRPVQEDVSDLVTSRLALYLRCLTTLEDDGVATVSSSTLAERFHLNAAQIRKDLAWFGEFGVRGVGYSVPALRRHLRSILGLDRPINVAIVGAGNLGLALADYPSFRDEGFQIVALFDAAPEKIGQASKSGVGIFDIRRLRSVVHRHQVALVVVAVPPPAAQRVVDRVVAAGVRAILNFSPVALRVPDGVKLKHVDLTVSMGSLSYHLAHPHEHRGRTGREGSDGNETEAGQAPDVGSGEAQCRQPHRGPR